MVDITITLTDEEKVEIDNFAKTQNFQGGEDFVKFQTIEAVKLAKFNEELRIERDKFKKPAEPVE